MNLSQATCPPPSSSPLHPGLFTVGIHSLFSCRAYLTSFITKHETTSRNQRKMWERPTGLSLNSSIFPDPQPLQPSPYAAKRCPGEEGASGSPKYWMRALQQHPKMGPDKGRRDNASTGSRSWKEMQPTRSSLDHPDEKAPCHTTLMLRPEVIYG